MKSLRRLTLACFLACSFTFIAQAQSSTTLRLGIPFERELGPGESHKFTVEVEGNRVVQFVVEQKGIDVVITVSGPDGKFIGDYDTTNGANGNENVSFFALTAGVHSIDVMPLDPTNKTKGRYEIKLLELRKATDQEQKNRENAEIAKTRAIELLRSLEGTIVQIKAPATRIRSRVKAADLLWEDDEKRASEYISDATTDLKELIALLDPNALDYTQDYNAIWQLRFVMIQLLAEIDPEKALSLLYSTAPPAGEYGSEELLKESSLELMIVGHLIESDPRRSFQIARDSLKQGFPLQLLGTITQLKQREPKLATELANEMLEKLLAEKLSQNIEASVLTLSLLGEIRAEGGSLVVDQNRLEFLSDEKYRQLVQKALSEALEFSLETQVAGYHGPYQWNMLSRLNAMGSELDKIVAGSSALVQQRYQEITRGHQHFASAPQPLNGTVEESLETIEKAPVASRDQLYYMLANREANKGDTRRAREIINGHVKTPQRYEWLRQIEEQEITQAISSGRLDEALRRITALRTPRERATHLPQLLDNIHMTLKPASALSLLEQARALLPASPVAQDQDQMVALLEIARAFSQYDSKRAFEIVDPLVDQFNELCAAARTLQGYGENFFRDDELINNESSFALLTDQMTTVIGSLALRNFERAKSISDRIRQPEVRLQAYLDIAQQSIDGPDQN